MGVGVDIYRGQMPDGDGTLRQQVEEAKELEGRLQEGRVSAKQQVRNEEEERLLQVRQEKEQVRLMEQEVADFEAHLQLQKQRMQTYQDKLEKVESVEGTEC